MIYITGDTHGDQIRFIENNMLDSAWTERDTLIVCGDFGYVFLNNPLEDTFLDFLARKPYTICFCDGNHENFPAIFSYPKEEWKGGYVHKIRDNVLHLMRGQVFEIEGKKVFTMGGAYSIDRDIRTLGRSYWTEEIPTKEEYEEARKNLSLHSNQVDLIISHTAPTTAIKLMGYSPDPHDQELTDFLDWVNMSVFFERWYFGHWHLDKMVTDKLRAIYYGIHAFK